MDLNNRWILEEQIHYGVALCLNDDEERGKQILDKVLEAQIDNLSVSYVDKEVRLAAINAFLGRKREAYSWLYKSEWKGCSLYDVKQDLWFGSINQEEEFQKIVKEVHEEKRKVREEIARLEAAGEWEI